MADPRPLPVPALLMLGHLAEEEGALDFLIRAKEEGFGIDQPGDHDLEPERWHEVAMLRVRTLCVAFHRAKERGTL